MNRLKEPSNLGIMSLDDVEEILEREVVGIGTGAHINIPKKHIGKHARVIIKRGIYERRTK